MSSQAPRTHQHSIRLRLALVFVVPLVSLLALWAFGASVTYSNAIQEHDFSSEDALYGGSAQTLGAQLAAERTAVYEWLSSNGGISEGPMLDQFTATQKAVTAFVNGVRASPGSVNASARPELASFEHKLAGLNAIRDEVRSGQLTPLAAFQAYNSVIDAQFSLYSRLVSVNDAALYQQAVASVEAGQALDLTDQEVALISGAFADGGRMSTAARVAFAQAVGSNRLLMNDALSKLSPSVAAGYRKAISSAAYRSFRAIENRITGSVTGKGTIPVSRTAFLAATRPLLKDFQAAESHDRVALTQQASRVGNKVLLELLLAGGLGLIAIFLSVYLIARFAGRVSRELRGLQRAALELSTERLPRVVSRLSEGGEVDVAAEVSPLPAAEITEVAQVSEAFGTVQRMAVESAVGQARLRNGVNQVFRNLAWRSQSLLHRQLSLLDAMERKTTDPEALDELFRLDHLTTRMRRHAESLIILSGTQPGRAWRDPVPILDVLRGAVAEIEDYKRVTVTTDSEDAVVGSAVADLIHLLAELVENATFYSPNSTEVQVRAGRVANGFVVEIEDRGIGISDAELDRINERLANPPEFDPVNSDQLGLFVVARLAARHSIKVTIRQSPYGGTEAVVLLPHQIVVARGRGGIAIDSTMADWLPLPGRAAAIAPSAANGTADPGPPWPDLEPVEPGSGASPGDDPRIPAQTTDLGLRPSAPDDDGAFPIRPAGPGALPVRSAAGGALPRRVAGASLAPRHAAEQHEAPAVDGGSGNGVSPPAAETPAPASATDGSPAPASATDGSPTPASVAGSTPAGLPRRVRQASLAPQLKAEVSSPVRDDPEPEADDGRSPDESRALVDALQFGWQRGRAEADADDSHEVQASRTEDREST